MTSYRTSTARPALTGRAGTAGLVAVGVSVACTFAVAVAGPSVMEPALPGRPGQPPWSLSLHPSPYLAIGLTAAGLAAGALGLVLALRAVRRGWSVPARAVLIGGLLAAAALTLVPPFGSSDHLSYAAYGRMLVTGHNPYTTTPAQLAALGDPVARAVQDWRGAPSVYGPLATAIQALAALAGGTSARLTVFVLGLANLAAFAVVALLLHRMTRTDPARQLGAALLWAANPLLLQVLVAGAHVDGQAVAFGVAAVVVMSPDRAGRPLTHPLARAALAGVLVGLGFAVKVTIALTGLGLALALGYGWWRRRGPGRELWPPLAALGAGFAVTAGAALALGGPALLRQTSQASDMVSIGSPWRVIRSGIHLVVTGPAATDIVKAGAVALAVLLAVLLIRGLAGPGAGPGPGTPVDTSRYATVAFALALAWLFAWPYVLPWYDALGWALLPLAIGPAGRGNGPARGTVEGLGWLLLARTAALGFGYLPARQTDAALPSGLGWLQPVVRHGITPAILAVATVWLVMLMVRSGRMGRQDSTGTGGATDPEAAAAKAV
jgi:alpha-1,6-mannosyltransferase